MKNKNFARDVVVAVMIAVALTTWVYCQVPGVSGDQIGGGSTAYMSSTNNLGEIAAAGSYCQAVSRTNLGMATAPTSWSNPTFTYGASRSFVTTTSSTGFQISSTLRSSVNYTVTVATTATIGGASAGLVYLETAATNSTTPSAWSIVSETGNSQTITLAIALQSVQGITSILSGDIPAGNYVRIRSSAVSGTPTFTYNTGEEVTFSL